MKTIKVLSLDGGGMRGLYTAEYLNQVTSGFAQRRNVTGLDLGKGFDLIVGTSTGAIIACALAVGVPLSRVVSLYREHGKHIFQRPLPQKPNIVKLFFDICLRASALRAGELALRSALESCFGSITVGQVYQERGIALAIPCVELEHHSAYVFKTPHIEGSNHRDDNYKLVEVCLAATAAPIFRSLAALDLPSHCDTFKIFADGGLWANNPVLIGLIDALQMSTAGDRVEIFCMGTCPRPSGDYIKKSEVYRGLLEWKFGGAAAVLAMDSQEFAYDHMARLLTPHLDRDCEIMRFPRGLVSSAIMQYLGLDETREEAYRALMEQAGRDASLTNSLSNDAQDPEGGLINKLFMEIPEFIGDEND